MKRRSVVSGLPTRLAADRSSAFTTALKSKLLWQAEIMREIAEDNSTPETRRRNLWQHDALMAAAEVIPELQKSFAQNQPSSSNKTAGLKSKAAEPQAAPEPTLTLLIDIGWLAWEAGLESHALRILGGVGGAADGAMGRAMLQASAYMNDDRTADAATVLEEAISRWGDTKGEVSSTLVMLWLSLGNPQWQVLARKVLTYATDASAREICSEALISSGKSPMGHLN
ncbi:MAG: hypothetical protein HEQ39_13490 [Rhizobacter sp.]